MEEKQEPLLPDTPPSRWSRLRAFLIASRPSRKILCVLLFVGLLYEMFIRSWFPEVSFPSRLVNNGQVTAKGMAQIKEIADLMDEIYTTLADMTFIPQSAIKRGPHTIPSLNASTYVIDPLVTELMRMLPYVDGRLVDERAWLFGGEFADYTNEGDLEQSRDPLYAEWESRGLKGEWNKDNGEYMKPWYTALTLMGNHQSVLLLDAKKNRIWLFNTDAWGTEDLDSNNIAEMYPREGELKGNSFAFDRLPSFDAPTFMKDMVARYRSLQLMPWDPYYGGDDDINFDKLRSMYMANGWPDNFDSDAFRASFIRYKARPSEHGFAEDALNEIEKYEGKQYVQGWLAMFKEKLAKLEQELVEAPGVGEQWRLRWEKQIAQWSLERILTNLEAAKAEVARLCPDGICVKEEDMILWELRNVEKEYEYAKRAADDVKQELEAGEVAQEDLEYKKAEFEKLDREFQWHKLAYEQCKVEVERQCKKTGCEPLPKDDERHRTLESLEGHRKQALEDEALLAAMSEWLTRVPTEVPAVREEVERTMSETEERMRRTKESNRKAEEYLASLGNPLDS